MSKNQNVVDLIAKIKIERKPLNRFSVTNEVICSLPLYQKCHYLLLENTFIHVFLARMFVCS